VALTGGLCPPVHQEVSQPFPHPAGLMHGLNSYPSKAGDRLDVWDHTDTCLVLSPSTADNKKDPQVPGKAGLLWVYCQGTARKSRRRSPQLPVRLPVYKAGDPEPSAPQAVSCTPKGTIHRVDREMALSKNVHCGVPGESWILAQTFPQNGRGYEPFKPFSLPSSQIPFSKVPEQR
jgi:hypothetical protein